MSIHFNGSIPSETVFYKPEEKSFKSSLAKEIDDAHKRALALADENEFLSTYKALHLGGEETLESKMIRSVITVCPTHSEAEIEPRLSNYSRLSKYLSNLTNEQLSTLLTAAVPLKSGIGGETLSMEIEGIPLFIKKIRLTAVEQQSPRSTLNLFGLPSYYQYGVGSMGFGTWREIAAHEMTTEWVLNGECQNFPLMYHSRKLPRMLPRTTQPRQPTAEELEERRQHIEYWNGSSAIGTRIEAADTASTDVVVFMENIPQTLSKWFHDDSNRTEQAITRVERELNMVALFMKSKGFLHFDAHFHNILASDNHVYFADFGLVMSQRFDLSLEERAFLEQHKDYDQYYIAATLAQYLITASLGQEEREEVFTTYLLEGKMPDTLPPAIASIAQKYRPIAVLMDKFITSLREGSKNTPYPEAELAQEWAKLQKNNYSG